MYSKMKACVKVKLSSPICFALFMNDLVNYLKRQENDGIYKSQEIDKLFVFMYADDVAGLVDTAVRLQRMINNIDTFCDKVGMKVNLDK